MRKFFPISSILVGILLTACTQSDPGPLQGTWQVSGMMPMKITFRSGETESLGVIEKVEYEIKDSDVVVHYLDGLAKGMAIRYHVVDSSTLQNQLGNLRRIN